MTFAGPCARRRSNIIPQIPRVCRDVSHLLHGNMYNMMCIYTYIYIYISCFNIFIWGIIPIAGLFWDWSVTNPICRCKVYHISWSQRCDEQKKILNHGDDKGAVEYEFLTSRCRIVMLNYQRVSGNLGLIWIIIRYGNGISHVVARLRLGIVHHKVRLPVGAHLDCDQFEANITSG